MAVNTLTQNTNIAKLKKLLKKFQKEHDMMKVKIDNNVMHELAAIGE